MVRLVSVDIEFRNTTYLALVSVRKNEEKYTCEVRYIDNDLHYVLPNELLVFNLNEGLKHPQNMPNEMASSLMTSTIRSLRYHLFPDLQEINPV